MNEKQTTRCWNHATYPCNCWSVGLSDCASDRISSIVNDSMCRLTFLNGYHSFWHGISYRSFRLFNNLRDARWVLQEVSERFHHIWNRYNSLHMAILLQNEYSHRTTALQSGIYLCLVLSLGESIVTYTGRLRLSYIYVVELKVGIIYNWNPMDNRNASIAISSILNEWHTIEAVHVRNALTLQYLALRWSLVSPAHIRASICHTIHHQLIFLGASLPSILWFSMLVAVKQQSISDIYWPLRYEMMQNAIIFVV